MAQHKGHPPWHLHTLEIPTHPLAEEKKKNHHSPSMGLAPISWFGAPVGLRGGCSPSQPLLGVQWILQLNSMAGGDLCAPAGAPLESQEPPAAGRSRFGWCPCAQTVMDSRWPRVHRAHHSEFSAAGLQEGLVQRQHPSEGGTRRRRMKRRRRKRRGMVLFLWLP